MKHTDAYLSASPEKIAEGIQQQRRLASPDHPAWQPIAGTTPLSLVDLREGDCKWPVTGGFCAQPTEALPGDGHFRRWCPYHTKRGTVVPRTT